MIRPIAIVTTGTLASRLTGFVRDAMVAALLGAGAVADAFLVAFQLVTLARRLLTEGALNASLVPAWLRVRDRDGAEAARAFGGRALGTIGLVVALCAAGLALTAPILIAHLAPGFVARDTLDIAVAQTRLMLPYLAFAGPVAVLLALANAQRRVGLSAAAPVLFNALLIATMAVLLARSTQPADAAWIVAVTVGLAGFCQLVLLAGTSRDVTPVRASFDAPIRALLRRAVPGMFASAGPQLLIVAGAIVASREPSGVAWLYFASRLIDLPLGIVSALSGAVFVTEAAHASRDGEAARLAQTNAVGIAVGLAMPAAMGLFLLAEPIVGVVFVRGAFTPNDAAMTARALEMLALGLPAHALGKALSPAFFARGDTFTPLIAALAGLCAAMIAAALSHGIVAIAAAISLGGAVSAAILHLCADVEATRGAPLLRLALASILMGVGLTLLRPLLAGASGLTALAVLIAAGGAIYLAALVALRVLHAAQLRAAFQTRDLRGDTLHGRGTAHSQDQNK